MCGIFGIVGAEHTSFELYNALRSLQHRGQDSAGILTYSKRRFYMHKGLGLVEQVFDENELNKLEGDTGIGHIRYPTIGAKDQESERINTQPFLARTPGIAMAHNGNISNYSDLRESMERRRRYMVSECDVEVLNAVLSEELSVLSDHHKESDKITPDVVFKALEMLMSKVEGSYSVICVLADVGFIAFRDPYGIRPLIWGHREQDGAYAFTSETVALDLLDFKVTSDLKCGEAIFIPENGDRKPISKIIKQAPQPAHCMFEWVYFARPSSTIENHNVYISRLNLGRELSKEFSKKGIELDLVIPVPDTSRPAALNLARKLGVPGMEGFDKNRYSKRTFIMPESHIRVREVDLKLTPIIHEIRGKKVGVVDDSVVRGPTSKKVIKILRQAGASEVHLIITCPPITNSCHLGIDIPTKGELIASTRNVEEIRKSIGADSWTYLSLAGLKTALKMGDNICAGCLTGEYPYPPPKKRGDITLWDVG